MHPTAMLVQAGPLKCNSSRTCVACLCGKHGRHVDPIGCSAWHFSAVCNLYQGCQVQYLARMAPSTPTICALILLFNKVCLPAFSRAVCTTSTSTTCPCLPSCQPFHASVSSPTSPALLRCCTSVTPGALHPMSASWWETPLKMTWCAETGETHQAGNTPLRCCRDCPMQLP
jgi:hypothetical protein